MLFPFASFTQEFQPSDFSGTLIFRRNKTIEFSYLNNPDCGTGFNFFSQIPEEKEFNLKMTMRVLPFSQIEEIIFFKFTDEEELLLHSLCPDCHLVKAKVTSRTGNIEFPDFIFVVLKQIEWKSSTMKGFEDLHYMEARFINRISFVGKR